MENYTAKKIGYGKVLDINGRRFVYMSQTTTWGIYVEGKGFACDKDGHVPTWSAKKWAIGSAPSYVNENTIYAKEV